MLVTITTYFFAVIMLVGGLNHFVQPHFYDYIMPSFFPKAVANYASGLVEIIIAFALFIPAYRAWGALAFMVLMLIFLPLHVWEVFREKAAIGPPPIPIIRLVLQFVFIYGGWWLWQVYK